MIHSMTAFASRSGAVGDHSWSWDIRSVNARGLDLRLRLPDGIDGLEAGLRKAAAARLDRGAVSIGLRLSRDTGSADLVIDPVHLEKVLRALDEVQERAVSLGITLGQPTAADVLSQRGVLTADAAQPAAAGDGDDQAGALRDALLADFDGLLDAFCAMRAAEGGALQVILRDRIDAIDDRIGAAQSAAADRLPEARGALIAALDRLNAAATDVTEDRLAQELALLAVKADVTEEIDRLRTHVAAARDLLSRGGPIGRKLDFLMQEFNREANTLCSKSGSAELTRVGLDIKTLVDQLREQVQNVE